MTTIKLQHPVMIDGVSVNELTMRRPKVRDLESIDRISGDTAKAVALVANLAEIATDEVRELDAEDFVAVSTAVGDFLGERPATSGA